MPGIGFELAKKFCNLSSLEATHRAAAQATMHEVVLSSCQAHNTTYGLATFMQTEPEREQTLCGLWEAANKVWKEVDDIVFTHLLQYDAELASFVSSAEDALHVKREGSGSTFEVSWGQPAAPPWPASR